MYDVRIVYYTNCSTERIRNETTEKYMAEMQDFFFLVYKS